MRILSLNNNNISDNGAKYLADFITRVSFLEMISLSKYSTLFIENNAIQSKGARDLGQSFEINNSLALINLYGNHITNESAAYLIKCV